MLQIFTCLFSEKSKKSYYLTLSQAFTPFINALKV